MRAIKPDLTFLVLKLCRSSWTITWFSAIHLPGMKVDWHGEIILCRIGHSFATMILEITLYMTLQRLIGRKLFADVGSAVFGMTMRELLASLGKQPFAKKDKIAFVTASPTVG